MTTQPSGNLLSLADRFSFINNYQLFCLLGDQDKQDLALLIHEKFVLPDTPIVREGDVVDGVYFIFSGTATVTRKITKINYTETITVATLQPGDAIGLSMEGLFSHLGLRTASVTATSPMALGFINIQELVAFLRKPGVPYPGLKNISEKVLLMNFLENTHLFGKLTPAQFEKVTKNIGKFTIKKDEVLFQQGDPADKCYFIISGQLALFAADSQRTEHFIKFLETGSMVGEAAFFAGDKRNATIRANLDSELFVLDESHIKILEKDPDFIDTLKRIRLLQLRPQAITNASISEPPSKQGQGTTLNLPNKSKTLTLSEIEYRIWESLDGKTTLESILHKLSLYKWSIFDLYHAIKKMEQAGLVEKMPPIIVKKPTSLKTIIQKLFKFLYRSGSGAHSD